MNIKEILLEQMNFCFDKKNWFVSLTESLEGLTSDQASYKDSGSNHSIKEIVVHIIYWNELYLNRFKGFYKEAEGDNNLTFSEKSISSKNPSWEKLTEYLKKVSENWQKELSKSDEKKMLSKVPNGSDSWNTIISQIILHTAYHVGQIVSLRKQYGNWDSKLGVA